MGYTDSTDIIVRYDGGSYTSGLLKSIASSLTASLFYLELLRVPSFYRSPDICHAVVRCRLPPGNALLSLLKKLEYEKTVLVFRGDELDYTKVALCESYAMKRCRAGKPFLREVQIKANSLNSMLDISIQVSNGDSRSMSNCPYRLDALLKAQRLEYFSWPTGRRRQDNERCNYDAEGELEPVEQLQRTLSRLSSKASFRM